MMMSTQTAGEAQQRRSDMRLHVPAEDDACLKEARSKLSALSKYHADP